MKSQGQAHGCHQRRWVHTGAICGLLRWRWDMALSARVVRLQAGPPGPAAPHTSSSRGHGHGGPAQIPSFPPPGAAPWLWPCLVLQAAAAVRTRPRAGWGGSQRPQYGPQEPTCGITTQNTLALIHHYPEPRTAIYSCIKWPRRLRVSAPRGKGYLLHLLQCATQKSHIFQHNCNS